MNPPKLSDRKFGLIFATIFAIFSIIGWLVFDLILHWAMACSGIFLSLSLFVPSILLPLNRLWGIFTRRIHVVVNFMLLASFFYILILPFALVMKCFGRDSMKRKSTPGITTYWNPVMRQTDETTLSDMF